MKWEAMPELQELVQKIKDSKKFKERLVHICPDKILYAMFSKKLKEGMNVEGKIVPVPDRFAIFLKDFAYVLEIHKESWHTLSEGQRLYVVIHELFHIPTEGFDKESKQYKKTVKHDLLDFKELIREFGVDREKADSLVEEIG